MIVRIKEKEEWEAWSLTLIWWQMMNKVSKEDKNNYLSFNYPQVLRLACLIATIVQLPSELKKEKKKAGESVRYKISANETFFLGCPMCHQSSYL